MHQDNIKQLIKRYKLISTGWLTAFLMFSVVANWFLVTSSSDKHFELGLEQVYTSSGFVWGAIIIGLNMVLQLFFYSLEKILLEILSKDGVE